MNEVARAGLLAGGLQRCARGSWSPRSWASSARLLTYLGLRAGREVSTLLFSSLAIIGVISSVGLTMFPFILPSSIDPRSSLTVWNASSSHLTLFIMLVVPVIFVPIILAYTAWVYKVLWGKVDREERHRRQRRRLLRKDAIMWYFAWILGLPLAAIFAVVNAMWLELQDDQMYEGIDKRS